MLSAAMASRRQALKDDDKEEQEDWSDEDWN